MELTIIENISDLTAAEQKTLYTAGADVYTGVYYLVADIEHFSQNGKDVVVETPALRSLSQSANVGWIITEFRGKKVGFGSATIV